MPTRIDFLQNSNMTSIKKWRGTLRQTSIFQIILCVILFHSLASILIIYIHLAWFFSEEDHFWTKTNKISHSKAEMVVLNKRSVLNVLKSRIISSDEISSDGWWMDHARWETDIRCYNQRWTICSKGFSTTCKTDNIRAIYQYIVFEKDSYVKGLEFSVTATGDQLEPQVIGASFGALALVKTSDGSFEYVQIQFPSNIDPLTVKSASFSAGEHFISSVIVMLMCYGYTGNIHFTDPVLIPYVSSSKDNSKKLIQSCPSKRAFPFTSFPVDKVEQIVQGDEKSIKSHQHLVTLVTQVSMDRLSALERSLQLWDGPVSLVIYVTSKNTEKTSYEWQRLYIQKKVKNIKLSTSSHVSLVFGTSKNEKYPINVLRNLAIRQVKSAFMFLLDADFQPSPDFQQKFAASYKQINSNKTAFIVPAFEYVELPQRSDNAPQTKEELLQLLHREEPFILPFRISESSDSHRLTDYWKWYRVDKAYLINSFSDKYEPYVVVKSTDSAPMYDERFSGYGMNKVTHITQLFAANYTFMVLPDVWVLHLPHKVSTYAIEFLQNAHQRLQNRLERFEFVADIMNSYKISHCSKV